MKYGSLTRSVIMAALFSSAIIALSTQQVLADSDHDDNACKGEMGNIKSWFPHSQTPEPDGNTFQSSSFCEFNAWAWQTFLWITQEEKGQPRFLNYPSPYEFLGIESREVLKPHTGHTVFDEIAQAGPDGILVDQNGNVVYYSQYLNPEWVQFIKSNKLMVPAVVQAMDPNTEFPINAVEYKASWRIVEEGEDTSNVFTMKHDVYGLKNQAGKIVVDTNNIRNVELALVGMHIAGVVKNHPEMIWATFEHNKNSPVVPAVFTPSTVIADSGDYTFFDTDPPQTTPAMSNTYAGCNINYVASPYMKLDEANQKLSPITQVCLQYKNGSMENYDLSPDPDINKSVQSSIDGNQKSIIELNGIVQKNLSEENSLWANYHEVGSIWFIHDNALKPGMTLQTDFDQEGKQFLIGSLALSNSTIETYTQFASTQNNCFRCHNTEQRLLGDGLVSLKASNLNISYAFSNIYTWAQMLEKQKEQ